MSTIVNCPACQTAYDLPNESLGKKVRCRNCQFSFPTSRADAGRLDVEAVGDPDDGLVSDVRVVKSASSRRIRDDDDEDARPSSRRRGDDDDDVDDAPPPKKKSSALMYFLLGGGVLLFFICGGCGGFGYYLFVYLPKKAREAQEQMFADLEKENNKWAPVDNNPFNPGPGPGFGPGPGPIINPPQNPPGQYANLDEALEDAKPGDVFRAQEACKWIARQKADDARRLNVINRLEPLLADVFIRDEAARTIGIWASKDQVPLLITMLDNDSREVKKVAFDTLPKFKDERAIEPLAKKLKGFDHVQAERALAVYGPVAEKEVVKYVFDPEPGTLASARKLLKAYGTKNEIYATQAIEELTNGDANRDANRKLLAAAWLEKTPAEASTQDSVAKALDPMARDNDFSARSAALKALKNWATKDNTPTLIGLLDNQDGNIRKQAMEILGKLKDERAVLPIALRLLDFFDRQTASNTLKGMGSIVEIPEVVNGLKNKDAAIRLEVCRILGAAGTSKSVQELERIAKTDKNKEVAAAAAIAVKAIEDREKGGK
jgi:predicted Zn finger-like uncharacterized protein